MDSTMRVIPAAIGALIGASLASPGNHLLGLVIGAAAGFGIAESTALRARVDALDADIKRLRKGVSKPPETPLRPVHPAPPTVNPPAVHTAPPAATPPAAPTPLPAQAQPRADAPPAFVGVIRNFLTGGNTLVRAGVIVLFFGVAFLLRYVAEHTRVPIELRLSGIALGSMALLAEWTGWADKVIVF